MIKRMTKIILGVVFLSMVTFIFVSFSKTLHKEKEIDGRAGFVFGTLLSKWT